MKISLNWLKEFVDIPVNYKKPNLKNVVVGYVEHMEKHPNADRLNIAQVDVGDKKIQIVCGGTNLKEHVYVPVALPGAVLPGNFEIKVSRIRGIESNGMICHLSELGLAKEGNHEISIIKKAEPGTPFIDTLNLKDYGPEELGYIFTTKVAEVEKVEKKWEALENVVAGKLISFEKIEGSKHHHKGTIDIGSKKITLVFGSVFKVEKGLILPIALPGAKLPAGEIKKTEVHGIMSEGMIASDKELGIENSKTGLTIFPKNTQLGKPIAEILGFDDVIFEIENKSITHRPDLWGHYGIAREFAAILNEKLKPINPKVKLPHFGGKKMTVEVKNKTLCPRYCGIIIENIKVENSPEWLAKRLNAVGRGTHNNIVDVTNYVTEELGQPLHAFDINNISEKIIVRNATKNEKITTLDKEKRTLSEEMLVIADASKPLAIAGVMGGSNSEITEKTKTIFIESATFNAASVRKTGAKLGLRTEAVQRFEKSLDPVLAEKGLLRACELILEICPGSRVAGPITDIKNFNEKPIEIELNIANTCSKIGTEISEKEMVKILEKLEFKAKIKGKKIKITIPSFRATKDVSIEEDIVEEIARIHGYDKVSPILPKLPTKLPIQNIEREKENHARNILSFGLGFTEIMTYSFYGKRDIASAKLPEQLHIQLENFLTEDQTHLRVSLVPNMLKSLEQNIKSFNSIKIYEIGRTYLEYKEFFPIEEKYICGMIVENKKSAKGKELFFDAKGALETFLNAFGTTQVTKEKDTAHHSYTNPSKCLSYKLNDEEIARVFEIHPVVLKNYGLEETKISCFEINFSNLVLAHIKAKKYTPLPKFPETSFDVSVIFPKSKTVEEIEKIISSSGAKYITDVKLFDVFTDKSIGEKSRALAFKIILRSDEKTLTLEEMAESKKCVFEALKKSGGTIRGT